MARYCSQRSLAPDARQSLAREVRAANVPGRANAVRLRPRRGQHLRAEQPPEVVEDRRLVQADLPIADEIIDDALAPIDGTGTGVGPAKPVNPPEPGQAQATAA